MRQEAGEERGNGKGKRRKVKGRNLKKERSETDLKVVGIKG